MINEEELMSLPINIKEDAIIKVMGVGGGGCNAVNYMYRQGIQDVTFLVCNTDKQVLSKSSVAAKLQLGPGLGAGGNPEKAAEYAEESRDRIREALDDGTQMLFLTAGMGGGTGTGASATVAQVAQEMNILTVGIVTIPFAFEGKLKIRKAMIGLAKLAEHVDALLVINNEKLTQIYSDLNLLNAFQKADDVVCNAAKSIAEIITVPGYINTDFADVRNTLRNGGVAIMNVGQAGGENRITAAINNALNSPLVNTNDVHGAKRVLLQFYCSTEHAIQMSEITQINQFVQEVGDNVEVQWGASLDESLGEDVRVTIIATGYEVSDIPSLEEVAGKKSIDEAINDNYAEPKEEPKEDEQPQEVELEVNPDSTPAAEIPADTDALAGDSSSAIGTTAPQAEPKAQGTEDGEITISFPEEETAPQPEKPVNRGFGGWIRGNRR